MGLMKLMKVFAMGVGELFVNISVKYMSLRQLHQQEVCMMEKRLIGLGLKLRKETKKGIWQPTSASDLRVFSRRALNGAAKMERDASTSHEIQAGTLLQGPKSEKKRKERALNDVLGST